MYWDNAETIPSESNKRKRKRNKTLQIVGHSHLTDTRGVPLLHLGLWQRPETCLRGRAELWDLQVGSSGGDQGQGNSWSPHTTQQHFWGRLELAVEPGQDSKHPSKTWRLAETHTLHQPGPESGPWAYKCYYIIITMLLQRTVFPLHFL